MIGKDVSYRINIIRFPLMLGIVLFHTSAAFTYGPLKNDPLAVSLTRLFFSNLIGSMGVPLFFLISGFLYFKDFEPTLQCYSKKLKQRFRTAVIPYTIWNAGVLALKIGASAVPQLARFNTEGDLLLPAHSLYGVVFFIWHFFTAPGAGQFWFIRDLIVLCALSPLFWFAAKKLPIPAFIALAALWLSRESPKMIVAHDAYQSFLFFFIGALLWARNTDIKKLDRFLPAISAVWAAAATGILLSRVLYPSQTTLSLAAFSLTLSIGLVCVWTLTSRSTVSEKNILYTLAAYSFFLFAAHTPFLDIVQKVYLSVLRPSGTPRLLLFYFSTFLIASIVPVVVGIILKARAPRVFSLLTGGRG